MSRRIPLRPVVLVKSSIAAAVAVACVGAFAARAAQEPGAPPAASERSGPRASPKEIGWKLSATDEGVRIERIQTNSVAAKASLQEGDLILRVGGENIRRPDRIEAILRDLKDEPNVEIVVLRDGEELSYLLPLAELEESVPQPPQARSRQGVPSDLAEQVRQLQEEVAQHRILLNSLAAEVRALRNRLGVPAEVETEQEFEADVVAPLPGDVDGRRPIVEPQGGIVAPLERTNP